MPREWTKAQRTAIDTTDKTLLVSAAAGSGKTATLVERIVCTVLDRKHPADISRMLIVTYTKAAAGELRERVHSAISDALAQEPGNKYLQKQLVLVENAKICTIHAFCLDLLRANFQRLSLSPSFRVADEAELALLHRSVMNDLIDSSFESDTDMFASDSGLSFAAFVDNFAGSRDDKNLCDIFVSLYKKLCSYPEGVELLKISEERLSQKAESVFDTPYGAVVKEKLTETFNFYRSVYEDACSAFADDELFAAKYLPAFEGDLETVKNMLLALENNDYSSARKVVASYTPLGLKSIKSNLLDDADRFYCYIRSSRFKADMNKLSSELFSADEASVFDDMQKTADMCAYLYRFMSAFEAKIESEKKRRGICGFTDLERYSLELLYNGEEKSDLAKSVAENYDYVYIDEYQDVNAVQDKIFRAISQDTNRFMVGDIKQSIYSFRGAEPSIFSDYRVRFPDIFSPDAAGKCAAVFMSDNFRCDENVVNFVNIVSRFTMGYSSIDYRDEDDLRFKKVADTGDTKVRFEIYGKTADDKGDDTDGEEISEISAEAQGVAKEIKRLISEEKKNDGTPIRPRDIAILLQSVKKSGPAFVQALEAQGIPCSNALGDDFFETPEILLVLCLLNTIDNPRRDIYLAGLLRSPLYGFTMDDLIALRDCDDGGKMSLYDMLCAYTKEHDFARGEYFLEKLEKYRRMAEGMPVDRLIWALYRDTSALSLLTRDESGKTDGAKRDNLMFFYEYARNFESSSYKGLYNFIKYINSVIEERAEPENAKTGTDTADAVRIMTIHQSKGLEMPVCFVSDTAKQFNSMDLRDSLQFDYSLGVAMKLRDSTGFARYNTLARHAVSLKISEKRTEEYMRVLYVALTRARERLYVTAKLKSDLDKVMNSSYARSHYPSAYTLGSAKCFLDWILPAVGTKGAECFTFDLYNNLIENADCSRTADLDTPVIDPERAKKIEAEIREKLDFVYPYSDMPKIPAKLSVSRLYPDLLDDEGTDAEQVIPEMKTSPEFISGSFSGKAAERGTATHVFMQFCDFDRLERTGVREEIARLVEKRFISRDVAELINVKQVERFASGDFLARMKRAKNIWREFRFNIELDADMFTLDPAAKEKLAGEKVLVQGVIDCFFEEENGDIILCDYKTDYLTSEEIADKTLARAKLAERHSGQLSYYKKAVLKMCGKEPAHTYIYSLPLGDVIEL